jgi:hypothetical protein
MKNGVLFLGFFFIGLFLLAIVVPHDTTGTSSTLEVLSAALEREDYNTGYIHGEVKNTGSGHYHYVCIRHTLLGQDGEVVGGTIDSVDDLGPGETWKFKSWAHANTAIYSYRLSELKGYRR